MYVGGESMGMKKGRPDLLILFTTMLLLAIGIVMVFSASYYDTLEKDPYYYLRKQLTWAGIGILAMLIMMKIEYFRLKPYVNVFFGVTIVLLIIVLFTEPVNGSRRWIDLGFTNLQPSEIMKVAIILFLANGLSKAGPRIKNFLTGVLPFLLLLGVVGGLIMMEPDVTHLFHCFFNFFRCLTDQNQFFYFFLYFLSKR